VDLRPEVRVLHGRKGPFFLSQSDLLRIFFFFFRFIYLLYINTLYLSSDTPEEGLRSHYGWL